MCHGIIAIEIVQHRMYQILMRFLEYIMQTVSKPVRPPVVNLVIIWKVVCVKQHPVVGHAHREIPV